MPSTGSTLFCRAGHPQRRPHCTTKSAFWRSCCDVPILNQGGAGMTTIVREEAPTTDLWRMSATYLAEVIRSRQVSSQEVIEAHLWRIEAVNGSINAVVIVMAEEALKAANTADRTVADGADLGAFHGVPF